MLTLAGVRKGFGDKQVLDGIDLEVATGKTTVIIGESGDGKSVLLKVMAGLLRADAGEVRLFGEDLTRASDLLRTRLGKRVAVVFQNYALFDSLSVGDNVAFPLREGSRLGEAEIDRRVNEILELLEIHEAKARMPADLSGGMRKRVSLARAVITQPELVFFDEPTTGLDPVMIAFVDEMIRRTQERYRITSVVISHDMASVFRLGDHIAVLHRGHIEQQGPPEAIRSSDHPTVRAFLGAGGGERTVGGSAEEPGPPAAEFSAVHKSFGDNHVLRGVSFRVPPGEITVVIGGSGSGKSVIIKHILGLMKADSGEVRVFGEVLRELTEEQMRALRLRVGMVFQQAALLDALRVRDNIAFPLVERRKTPTAEITRRVERLLERLRLTEIATRWPGDISAGHRKRVALARALVSEPELMIYDEPTTGQDPVMAAEVDEMIVEANREFGITSVVISHDMESTWRTAHRVAMLHKGKIAAFGPPEEVFRSTSPEVRRFVGAGRADAPWEKQ